MKKIVQLMLMISLVFLVSCTTKTAGKPGCPYMKAKKQCAAGCSSSCSQAKKMKCDAGMSCGSSCSK